MAKSPRLHDMPTWLRVALGSLIGLGVGLLLLLARPTALLEGLELGILDARTRHFLGRAPPDERVVIAEILEEDVRRVQAAWAYTWPWPLELNAMAFQLMQAAGVRAVAVDLFHLDRGAALEDVELTDPEIARRDAHRFEHEKQQAVILGEALAGLGNVALAFELAGNPEYEIGARVAAAVDHLPTGLMAGSPAGIAHDGANLPVSNVARGARLLGFANVKSDLDGVVRRGPTSGRWHDRPVPSLALALASIVADGDIRFTTLAVHVGGVRQSLMPDGTFLLNFRGAPQRTYPRVRPADLLSWWQEREETGVVPDAARAALEGRILVWGVNLTGHEDILTTPLSGAHHGPEYQATMLDNLLHGDGRVRAGVGWNAAILLLLTIGLGAAAGAIRTRVLPHLVPLLAALVLVAGGYEAFRRGVSIDLFTPFMGIVLTWGATSVVRVLTEGRRNRWLEGTFGRYLAPSIIEALKRDPSMLALGGRRREISILFSDVAGFTKLSEGLSPDQVVQLLNHYLTMHSAPVMEQGGVVDKFIGDAVMAFFGDPVPSDRHAEQACRAALAVLERLPHLRDVWESMGLEAFDVRIGLNTGSVVVGNMGSERRFDYTCMGDAVNLASRLEGANKVFGSQILLGSQTYEEAAESIVARLVGRLVVVGRSQPERVYELLAMRESASPELRDHVEAFSRAQVAAQGGDLPGARKALVEAERLRPGDGPTAWFGALVGDMERGAIELPWSGIVTLKGK